MVFYRKYRPQTISELDLESVRNRLESILKQKEIPHAFLFTGPKGLGKTSTARILAKAINCEGKKNVEPCNKCDACISITNGSNLDVLEIDAASNRGIDEIRELRERIKYAPSALSKKVYIIDEVHMLTTDAFNALLKTLEEPPPHAVFILCTTELEKVPATISSRTFHITFKKPSKKEAVSSLERIVKGEKLDVEDGVLDAILAYAEGSFRDAAKVMEELVIASSGKKITKETLSEVYNSSGIDTAVNEILGFFVQRNTAAALKKVQELAEIGTDFKIVTEKIAARLHGVIMLRSGLEEESSDIEEFKSKELVNLLAKINESYGYIKTSVLPQIPLELVIIDFCVQSSDEKVVKNERLMINDTSKEAKKEEDDKAQNKDENNESPIINHKSDVGMFAKNAIPEQFFHALLESVKRDNHSIAGVLRGCRLIELGDAQVIFHAKYKFHKDKLNEAKIVQILDKRASELLNRKVHVKVEIGEK